jgi:hypothetical protein
MLSKSKNVWRVISKNIIVCRDMSIGPESYKIVATLFHPVLGL